MPFPTTRKGFFAMSENLAKTLNEDTQGRFRQKPSWVGARIAKSIPEQPENFNVNTLLDLLAKDEAKEFDVNDWAANFNGSLSELLEVIPKLISSAEAQAQSQLDNEYAEFVKVIFDDDDMDGFNYAVLTPTENENDFYAEDGWKLYTTFQAYAEALTCALSLVEGSTAFMGETVIKEVLSASQPTKNSTKIDDECELNATIDQFSDVFDGAGHFVVNGDVCTSYYIPSIPSKEQFKQDPELYDDMNCGSLDFTIEKQYRKNEIFVSIEDLLLNSELMQDGTIQVNAPSGEVFIKLVIYAKTGNTSDIPELCDCKEGLDPHFHCIECDCILGCIGDSDTTCKSCLKLQGNDNF
ncbi:hypothetical protein [Vibrio crassostreae]|uniref:hypothetical protein n=1 Tax=Vibrio crassostreae TaxID=246167 RepID=UPI001B3090A2|nr:hypothetical protein [Vibrio crassostreae]